MKNIEINEENKETYQKFYNVKKGQIELKHPVLFVITIVSAVIILLEIFISGIMPFTSIVKGV